MPRKISFGVSLNPGLSSRPLKLMEITGIFPYPAFLRSAADESDVVGSTASTAGLTDDHSDFICIIFTGKNRFHDLTDYHQRWIAGIIVYIFQAYVYSLFVVIRQYLKVISGCVECRLQKLEMDGRHLWAENCIILTHFFGEYDLFIAEE